MDLSGLIVDDKERGIFRYHRSAMTSEEILELERERIFDKCWLYFCHETELENNSEYLRRTVNGRPLFAVRGNDGQVRVFLNSCLHRGALICRQDHGTAEVFQCFYHAWTYNNRGELIGTPDEAGYPDSFKREEMSLKQPPRVESYRGLVFINNDANAISLYDYLGGAREYIDAMMDQAEEGMRVVPGSNKYDIGANWKLLIENSVDGYHGLPTHQTFFDYVRALWPEAPKGSVGYGRALGNGHTTTEYQAAAGKPIAVWTPQFPIEARAEVEKVHHRLVERFGEEYAARMAYCQRNLFIYPNLILNDVAAPTIRYWEPLAPNLMRVSAWGIAPKEESEILLKTRLSSFLGFLGPGGLATPDDSEALESCQAGFAVKEVEWSDISRGMHRSPKSIDEIQMRGFWRQWHANLMGQTECDVTDGTEYEVHKPWLDESLRPRVSVTG